MVLIYPTFLHQILHTKFTRLYRNLYMGLWAAFWPLIPIGHLRLFSILRRVYSTFVEGHIVYVHVIAIGPACAHASHVAYSYHRVLCTVVPSQPNSQSAVVIGGGNGWRTTACAPSSAPGPDRSSARVCLLTELCVAFVPAPTQPTVNGYGLGRNLYDRQNIELKLLTRYRTRSGRRVRFDCVLPFSTA